MIVNREFAAQLSLFCAEKRPFWSSTDSEVHLLSDKQHMENRDTVLTSIGVRFFWCLDLILCGADAVLADKMDCRISEARQTARHIFCDKWQENNEYAL